MWLAEYQLKNVFYKTAARVCGCLFCFLLIIQLIHHKNSGYTEFKVVGVYLSPATGEGKMWCAQLSFCLQHFQLVC